METKKTMEEVVNEKVSNLVAELEKLGYPQKVIEDMTKTAKKNFTEEFKENARKEKNAKKEEDEKTENYINTEVDKCLDLTKTEDNAIRYAFSKIIKKYFKNAYLEYKKINETETVAETTETETVKEETETVTEETSND